jgi:hypothetical protein
MNFSKDRFVMNRLFFSATFLLGSAIAWSQNSSPATLAEARLGEPYRSEIPQLKRVASGDASLLPGSLPNGLSLSAEGILSGRPEESGLFRLKIRAARPGQELELQVRNASGLRIAEESFAPAVLGEAYEGRLRAEGGRAPYSWEIDGRGGSLPVGLALRADGEVSGTPERGGSFLVLLRVTDADGVSYVRQAALRVESQAIAFNTTSLAGAFLNVSYNQTLVASGGEGGYEYTLVAGALPTGLTLSAAGVLSGTPTLIGSYSFTVQAKDRVNSVVQANYTVNVVLSGPRITTTLLPTGILNQEYTAALTTEGGNIRYTYRLLSGVLPAGVQLNNDGTFAGTPTQTGIFPLTIRVTDGGGQLGQTDLRLNVNSSSFQITTTGLSAATAGLAYSATLSSSGGRAPFVYSLLRGSLPAGMALSTAGSLTGTPTSAGTFNLEISARDAMGATAQVPLTLVVQSSALRFFSRGLANGQFGQTYSSTLLTVNGISPLTFSIVQGSLPAGLTLSSNGNISGTPTASGLYQITFRVLDAQQNAAQINLPLYVNTTGLLLRTLSLPSGQTGQAYSAMLEASGGTAPYVFDVVSGALPAGLTLSATGALTGIPSGNTGAAFTVRVKDAANAISSVAYLFNVNSGGISLDAMTPPVVETAVPYSFSYSSRGGASPYTYAIESGNLPPGLILSSAGVITGDSGASGTYFYNLRVNDSAQGTALFNQLIRVASRQLGFTTNRIPEVNTGVPYFAAFSAVNGIGPYTFSLSSGTLPMGITLDANGNLSGTTMALGSYPLTVQVTDSTGATAATQARMLVSGGYPFQIVTTELPAAKVGTAYSFNITSNFGKEPYTFQVERGSFLPEGLSMSFAGALTGTPTTAGTSSFVINSRDENGFVVRRSFTLKID